MSRTEMIRRIDVWHTGISKLPLFEYLNISKKEFDLWLTDNVLPNLYKEKDNGPK